MSTAQLRAAGIDRGAIHHRVRNGRLHRYHRGVYLVGVPRITPRGRLWAAVLATGGVLSHTSAGWLWAMVPTLHTPIEVIAPGASRSGLRVHRLSLDARDITTVDGLPVTSATRTLLDLAATQPAPVLREAVHCAERDRLPVEQRPGVPGAARLRAAARTIRPAQPDLPRSELERRFLAVLDRAGLPLPRVNHPLLGYVADFLWPEHRLVVEVDGGDHRARFQDDRTRDAALLVAGYRTVRFTWDDVLHRPQHVVDTLRALLA